MDRLGPVPQAGTLAFKRPIADAVDEACQWVRDLRRMGAEWQLLPEPTRPELYPNMGNQEDGPWHQAKRQIAEELEELTLLWQVGPSGRRQAHGAGVLRWRDSACTPEAVGVTGEKRSAVLEALLDVNRSSDGEPVRPARIRAAEEEWRPEPALEFYADFETVTDLADDFSRIPERGGQPLIFLIGCGHVEEGRWTFETFVADALDEQNEARIIDAWLAHMEATRRRLAPNGDLPRIIHWSPAETSAFENAYNAATERHPDRDWPQLPWFDFLGRVVRAEPVVVRGAMAFGLKAIAKALHTHGLIETHWEDSPLDGLGAMIGAWRCGEEADQAGCSLSAVDLMGQIITYNEIDCRVMMETVRYLRQVH